MKPWLVELLCAIGGGLVVAVLIWAWTNLLPLIMQRFYRDEPRIDRCRWKTTFQEENREYHEIVTLRQKGRRIQGQIDLHEEGSGVTSYLFEGVFKHLILTATYEPTDPADIERGTFTLKYNNQNKFIGQYIFFSEEPDKIISSHYTWERIS